MAQNAYSQFQEISNRVLSSFMDKYKRFPDRTYMHFSYIRPYTKVWDVINKLGIPYKDSIVSKDFVKELRKHTDTFIVPWFNSISIPKDQLSLTQLIVILDNDNKRTFKDLNIAAKEYVVKELINTMKSDVSDLNKLMAINLFSTRLNDFKTETSITKLIDRNFRTLKMPIADLSNDSLDYFMFKVMDKYISQPGLKTSLNVHNSLGGENISEMTTNDLIDFCSIQSIKLNEKEEALPELLLEDFSF